MTENNNTNVTYSHQIKRIYAWVDLMPKIGMSDGVVNTGPKLLLTIKLNQSLTKDEITRITIKKQNNSLSSESESWDLDLNLAHTYSYEIRSNEIVIRNGPCWKGCDVSVEMDLNVGGTIFTLVSNSVPIECVC